MIIRVISGRGDDDRLHLGRNGPITGQGGFYDYFIVSSRLGRKGIETGRIGCRCRDRDAGVGLKFDCRALNRIVDARIET